MQIIKMKENNSNNSKKVDKSFILNEIKLYYKFKTDAEFSDFLGVGQQTISNWRNRNTFDIDLIYTKCVNINANWLLSGEGEMFQNSDEILSKSCEKTIEKLTNYIEILERENENLKEKLKTK